MGIAVRLALVSVVTSFAVASWAAAPGDTDPAFGNQGVTTTPPEFAISQPTSVARDGSGRLYVLVSSAIPGYFASSLGLPPSQSAANPYEILRFSKDGGLDQGFGTNGVLTLPFPAVTPNSEGIVPIGLTLDEAHQWFLLTGGLEQVNQQGQSLSSMITISRVGFDGTLDTSFGNNGTVMLSRFGDEGDAINLLPDGSMLVAGGSDDILNDVFIARLDSDGTVDSKFGDAGFVVLQPGFAPYLNSVSAIAEDATGNIDLCGPNIYIPPPTNAAFTSPQGVLVVRLTSDGAPISSFDPGGFKLIGLGASAACLGIQPHDNGSFALAAFHPGKLIIASVTTSGLLDTGFNGTGLESGTLSNAFFGQFSTSFGATPSAAIQNDGKLVLAIAGGGQLYTPGDTSMEAGIVLTRVEGSSELQPGSDASAGGSGSNASVGDGSGSGSSGGALGMGTLCFLALLAGLRRRARIHGS